MAVTELNPQPRGTTKLLSPADVKAFTDHGYHPSIRAMSPEETLAVRRKLEAFEHSRGGPLSGAYRHKSHLLFPWLDHLVRNPVILDAVEDVLGTPDILVWTTNFFIKEPHDPGFVSWHQDATYWGLSHQDVVTAWVALADSTPENGALRVVPGTHKKAQLPHNDTFDSNNLLSRGQEIAVDVDEHEAVTLPLRAGEASLHHVLIVHGSEPNRSDHRRIGFAIRYIPTYVKQNTGPRDSATLVRGADRFGHFELETAPTADLSAEAIAQHQRATDRSFTITGSASPSPPT